MNTRFHFRFFDYSPAAPLEYRNVLESAVNRFDSASDGRTYTPYAASLVGTILGILVNIFSKINEENGDYANTLLALNVCTPIVIALSGFIIYICSNIADTAKDNIQELISQGVAKGFFNTTPHFSENNNNNIINSNSLAGGGRLDFANGKHQELCDLYTDANTCRILHKR
jgi:uncharacterized protein YacL